MRPAFIGRAMRRHWLLLLSVLLLGFLAAGAFVTGHVPKYSSTSVVSLQPLAGNPFSPTTPSTRTEQLTALTTEAGLVHTQAVVELARKSAGDALKGDVLQLIDAQVPPNSQVLDITYTTSAPDQAQTGAQALAEAYLQYRSSRAAEVSAAQSAVHDEQIKSAEQMLKQATTDLRAARSATNPDQGAILDLEQQVTLYANQLAQIKIEQSDIVSASAAPGDIINPAGLPGKADGMNPLLIGGVIVLLSAAMAFGLALLREHFDQRIVDGTDLAVAGTGPVLGEVEALGSDQLDEATRENYRRLSNALQRVTFLPNNTVLLAGVSEHLDIGTIARGLTHAFEEAGIRTVLVMADDTALADKYPGALGQPGLTDLLDGKWRVAQASTLLVPVSEHLSILPVGNSSDRLSALVQRRSLAVLLSELSNSSDLILVAGPAATSAAGGALIRACREAVIVASAGKSTMTEVANATALLGEGGAALLGSVLVRRPTRKRAAFTDSARHRKREPEAPRPAEPYASANVGIPGRNSTGPQSFNGRNAGRDRTGAAEIDESVPLTSN